MMRCLTLMSAAPLLGASMRLGPLRHISRAPVHARLVSMDLKSSLSFPDATDTSVASLSAVERPKYNLYAMDAKELEELILSWGEKKFRAKQIVDWVYVQGCSDFDSFKNLPLSLRKRLKEEISLGSMQIEEEQISRDGTQKRLWRLADGQLIESVLMPYDTKRRTACISSQVGCAMGCTFCATGQMGFKRNLSADEIFEQAARFATELRARDERLSNVVFMGMGEPFMNYDAVMKASKRLMTDLGIGARHITISTVGVVPRIRDFADLCAATKLEIKLAISLHSSSNVARSAIMPVNRKYDLKELVDACHYYVERSGRRISFEWALIAGQNDSVKEARALGKLLKGLHAHVNLIPLNPTRGFDGRPSSLPDADSFVHELGRYGVPATVRVRRGIDIDAGCGQLADSASKKKQESKARDLMRAASAK
mmetsp:Transcript_55979/g.121864  ORF Transcript_55979/g.121864 Transcript_55979/m.121864 type:complete len:427 (-) Transcript_55979:353-1633(-)